MKGLTPFHALLLALIRNEDLQKQVTDVDNLFKNDRAARKNLWSKALESGRNKGVTPFHWLLFALFTNNKSEDLQKQVTDVDNLFKEDPEKRRVLWCRQYEGGPYKEKTAFYILINVFVENKSVDVLNMILEIDQLCSTEGKNHIMPIVKQWFKCTENHTNKLMTLALINPEVFHNIQYKTEEMCNSDYEKVVLQLWQNEVDAIQKPGGNNQNINPVMTDNLYTKILKEMLLFVHKNNKWNENYSELFELYLLSANGRQSSKDERDMVVSGFVFFEGKGKDYSLALQAYGQGLLAG